MISDSIANTREQIYKYQGTGDCFMFRFDNEYIVDATHIGNMARFVNHSCEPNCVAEIIMIKESKHIILVSKRNIFENEEITYD